MRQLAFVGKRIGCRSTSQKLLALCRRSLSDGSIFDFYNSFMDLNCWKCCCGCNNRNILFHQQVLTIM
ncbi:hypothetical protein SUGI_0790080 [Cryptomeria japonica]|nr:hypothetical protein SUGI_0790080 [Cryptomeria japonica]